LVRVNNLSGENILELHFDPLQSINAILAALREQENFLQLRLFQDSVELGEDQRLQDLCKDGGQSQELLLSLVKSPGPLALTGHHNGSLQLWDLDGRCIHIMGGGSERKEHQVTGLEVDWAGRRALSGDLCHMVRLWDLETGHCRFCMSGHVGVIEGVAVDWDQHLALTHDAAGLLICWDLQTGQQRYLLFAHEGGVQDVEVDWARLRFVSVGPDSIKTWVKGQELWAWHLRGQCRLERLLDCGLHCSWEDDRLAACWSMAVHLWHLETGQLLWVLRGHTADICGIEVKWDIFQSLSWGEDGLLLLWDMEHGQLLQRMVGHQEAITGAVCTWDPFRCLSFGDQHLRFWRYEGALSCHVLNGHTDLICSAEVCWDREMALTWSDDSTLKVWDLKVACKMWKWTGPGYAL